MSGEAGPELTPVWRRVLARLARGEGDVAIAAALGLGPRTVSRHLAAIYRALRLGPGSNRRAAAVGWYLATAAGGVPARDAGPGHGEPAWAENTPALTPVRRAILAALANGVSNAAIAAQLGLTEDAVRYHLRAIYRALPLAAMATNKRTAAAVWYRRRGVPGGEGRAAPGAALTPLQWRILALLAAGHNTPGIAAAIRLSRGAVANHLVAIYALLPLGSAANRRVAAVAWYLREGHRLDPGRAAGTAPLGSTPDR
jgi:DNA-binding NarL/FixJ family response regulator